MQTFRIIFQIRTFRIRCKSMFTAKPCSSKVISPKEVNVLQLIPTIRNHFTVSFKELKKLMFLQFIPIMDVNVYKFIHLAGRDV